MWDRIGSFFHPQHPLDWSEEFHVGPTHGDLNLGNILLHKKNNSCFPWLIDFDKAEDNRPVVFDLAKLEIADWLNKNRKRFLNSRDLLDLGPLTLDEFSKDGAAVVQKDFLRMLRLNPPVSEESFSRFLNQCNFVWPDGSVPVRLIFSNEAKLAWVAQSVILFAKKFGQRLTEKTLENYQDIQVARKNDIRSEAARIDLAGVDFPSFIELANATVRTRWQDVVLAYRQRMLQS